MKKIVYGFILLIFILLCVNMKVKAQIIDQNKINDPAVYVVMVCADKQYHQFTFEKWQIDTGSFDKFYIPETCMITDKTFAVDGYTYKINGQVLSVTKNQIKKGWMWQYYE